MSGDEGEPLSQEAIPRTFFEYGRNLILAPAGAGKSTMLRSLAALMKPNETIYRSIPELVAASKKNGDPTVFHDWLMRTSRRAQGTPLAIYLDGLDEVRPADAQAVLDSVEAETRKDPQLAVIITDRVTRRAIDFDRWGVFGISNASINHETTWQGLAFIWRDSKVRTERAESIRASFLLDYPLEAQSISALPRIAFEWLKKTESTAISSDELHALAADREVAQLRRIGLVKERHGVATFEHPLYQAFCAAEYLKDEPNRWGPKAWNALTSGGASYAALGILLERVEDKRIVELVRSVDRWNYVAATSLISDDKTAGHRIPDDLKFALLLLMAHRRFSPTLNTSLVAEDVLRMQNTDPFVRNIRAASSPRELVDMARDIPDLGEWWNAWRGTFISDDLDFLRASITSDDYLLAWTSANVLSLQELTAPIEQQLLGILLANRRSEDRWRAVHALSSSRSVTVAESCLRAFATDGPEWVRYGALRVVLQIAARLDSETARRAVLGQLAQSAESIRGVPRWEREIERAADLRSAPSDWRDTFGLVVSSLLSGSRSLAEEDRWRAVSAMLWLEDPDPFALALRPMPGGRDAAE